MLVEDFSVTPGGVKNNGIDQAKLAAFRGVAKNGRDYLVIDPADVEGMTRPYHNTPFPVVAVVQESAGPANFALPKEQLGC